MKPSIKFILLIIFCSLFFSSNAFAQKYDLVGTWERTGVDDNFAGSRIKVVKLDGNLYRGKLVAITTAMTEYCFSIGEIKWLNIYKTANGMYDMDDLSKSSSDCSSWYASKYIEFADENTINITSMSTDPNTAGNYQVWIRVE